MQRVAQSTGGVKRRAGGLVPGRDTWRAVRRGDAVSGMWENGSAPGMGTFAAGGSWHPRWKGRPALGLPCESRRQVCLCVGRAGRRSRENYFSSLCRAARAARAGVRKSVEAVALVALLSSRGARVTQTPLSLLLILLYNEVRKTQLRRALVSPVAPSLFLPSAPTFSQAHSADWYGSPA